MLKAALINIFLLTLDHMNICHVKGFAHKPTDSAALLEFMGLYCTF